MIFTNMFIASRLTAAACLIMSPNCTTVPAIASVATIGGNLMSTAADANDLPACIKHDLPPLTTGAPVDSIFQRQSDKVGAILKQLLGPSVANATAINTIANAATTFVNMRNIRFPNFLTLPLLSFDGWTMGNQSLFKLVDLPQVKSLSTLGNLTVITDFASDWMSRFLPSSSAFWDDSSHGLFSNSTIYFCKQVTHKFMLSLANNGWISDKAAAVSHDESDIHLVNQFECKLGLGCNTTPTSGFTPRAFLLLDKQYLLSNTNSIVSVVLNDLTSLFQALRRLAQHTLQHIRLLLSDCCFLVKGCTVMTTTPASAPEDIISVRLQVDDYGLNLTTSTVPTIVRHGQTVITVVTSSNSSLAYVSPRLFHLADTSVWQLGLMLLLNSTSTERSMAPSSLRSHVGVPPLDKNKKHPWFSHNFEFDYLCRQLPDAWVSLRLYGGC